MDTAEVAPSWAAALSAAGIVSIVEARMAVESDAARWAAERRTARDLRVMGRALEERYARRDDPERLVAADLVFHRHIVAAAGNRVLLEMHDVLAPHTRTAMIDLLRGGGATSDTADHHLHVRIVEAIRDGAGEVAADLSRRHLMGLRALVR